MRRHDFHLASKLLALAASLFILATPALAAGTGSIGVTRKGTGPAMVFIAGLNSDSRTFTATCEAFAATHRCLLLDLPGFAGRAPVNVEKGFLLPMRDELIRLLRAEGVSRATLVGHSLGGVLAMMIGVQAPELAGRIVLIDSVPFYAAIQNPAVTAEQARQMAGTLRRQMSASSDEQFFRSAGQQMNGMSRRAERQPLLQEWMRSSDRATTTVAMTDMMAMDLRPDLPKLKQPLLVLGAWAAYAQYGSTLESTRAVFAAQYATAPKVDIRMSAEGYHFLTWDDGDWVVAQIRQFIGQ